MDNLRDPIIMTSPRRIVLFWFTFRLRMHDKVKKKKIQEHYDCKNTCFSVTEKYKVAKNVQNLNKPLKCNNTKIK